MMKGFYEIHTNRTKRTVLTHVLSEDKSSFCSLEMTVDQLDEYIAELQAARASLPAKEPTP